MTLEEKVEALRRVKVFEDLPAEQLEWFAANAREKNLEPGELLFRRGDSPDWMYVLLEGEAHARRNEAVFDGNIYIARAGDPATEVSGKLPFSRMKEFAATSRAVVPTKILLFAVELFPELQQKMPVLVERLVWNMSDRVRETTKADLQRDKLMALGKLSAGLAHELNNPAAAARRAASELLAALETLREADLQLCCHHLTGEQRGFLTEFEQKYVEQAQNQPPLDTLAQSDREDELGGWFAEQGIENGWDFAPVLVESGIRVEALEELQNKVSREAFPDALARTAAQLTAVKLVSDIHTTTARISELVGAIKEYTYMDQAPVQDVDIRRGLEKTLLILKYKLKKKNITVSRDYAEDLPTITALGSELNQMWTNLIDNAIDAMPEGGHLRLKTRREPNAVMVEIRDDGNGIPLEIQPHIFEPFFTTKAVGEGTGLGLDTVNRIVKRHHGNIRFETKPGDTCFQVRLPLK